MEECFFLTRVGQHGNDRLRNADLWFRELEQITNMASGTMDRTNPCGESNVLALPGSIFVYVRDMVRAVSTVEIDDLCSS